MINDRRIKARARQGLRWGLVVLALTFALVPRAQAAGPDESLAREIDRFVAAEMRRQHVPGVAVAVIKGDRVIVAKGYGEANVELHVPVTRETVFQSGSLGKQFAAVLVMHEVEEGKLALDDPISRYLPGAPAAWQSITVRNLLTHTSGIATYASRDVDFRRDYSEEELLKMAYGLPLEFAPGSRWSYSNTGYLLLGILIHQVSGHFYGDLLQAQVFAPLGMRSARIISEADIVPNRSAGYELHDGELKNQSWVAPTLNTTADGALYLSLDDYIAWDRGLRSRALLTGADWQAIYTPVTLRSGATYPYGFGWDVEEALGAPWYHHGGAWQGFRTFISRYLADELTVIVLANLADASVEHFGDRIARIVDPRLPSLEPDSEVADHDPQVTQRVQALLRDMGAGALTERDLPRMRHDFFPEELEYWRQLLHPLTQPARLTLLERRTLGDDQRFTYRAVFPQQTLRVAVTLTPAAEIADLDVSTQ